MGAPGCKGAGALGGKEQHEPKGKLGVAQLAQPVQLTEARQGWCKPHGFFGQVVASDEQPSVFA